MPQQIAIPYDTVGQGQLGGHQVPVISNADRVSILASPPVGAWIAWAAHGEEHSKVLVVPQYGFTAVANGEVDVVVGDIVAELDAAGNSVSALRTALKKLESLELMLLVGT